MPGMAETLRGPQAESGQGTRRQELSGLPWARHLLVAACRQPGPCPESRCRPAALLALSPAPGPRGTLEEPGVPLETASCGHMC